MPRRRHNGRAPGVFVTHEGQRMTVQQLAAVSGLTVSCVHYRWNAGLRGADLVRPSGAPIPKVRAAPVEPIDEAYRKAPNIDLQVREWMRRVCPWAAGARA